MKHAEVVFIEWVDSSHTDAGWVASDVWTQKAEPLKCFSVGQIVYEDKKSIVLVGSWDDGANFVQGGMRIPTVAIVKRTRLATTAPKRKVK